MDEKRTLSIIKSSAIFIVLYVMATIAYAQATSWGYEPGEVMPENWGTLSGFETCGVGVKQSPIDLSQSKLTSKQVRVKVKNLPDLEFDYDSSPLNVINNGHTVEFEYESGSVVRLEPDGPQYEVLQFHFHAPAEHSFEKGALYEMEMHIVHRSLSDPDQLAVVGVMIRLGAENITLSPIWNNVANLMNAGDHVVDHNQFINIAEALPGDKRYFSYSGSLTTPPCSEIVEWKVLREPIEMSLEQIHAFVSILDNSCCETNGNNRPTQELEGRPVVLDKRADNDNDDDDDDDD
ncbi:MAG: carbonic anhydrase family protein [Gammaproteobacteria bacterium]|nr:carbonic anhydrase family protein [Gammaproteobacteria bacterium]